MDEKGEGQFGGLVQGARVMSSETQKKLCARHLSVPLRCHGMEGGNCVGGRGGNCHSYASYLVWRLDALVKRQACPSSSPY